MDLGNYSCRWRFKRKGLVYTRQGKVLRLVITPKKRQDRADETEKTEQITPQSKPDQNDDQNVSTADPAATNNQTSKDASTLTTLKPTTTPIAERSICKMLKVDHIYGWNQDKYRAGDVLSIPKGRLMNEVLTIKARYIFYNRYNNLNRGNEYGSSWDNTDWSSHKKRRGNMNKPAKRRSGDIKGSEEAPDFNGAPDERLENQEDMTPDATPPAPSQIATKIDPTQEIVNSKIKTQTETFKVLSLNQPEDSFHQKGSIEVIIKKTTNRRIGQTRADWFVDGTKKYPFNDGYNESPLWLEDSTELKLQLRYNPEIASLEIITSQQTGQLRSIRIPPEDLKNLTQISIGDDVNGVSIDYISICQPIKPTISLTMEVKMETVNLICTSTGPPFLTGYWKVGYQRFYYNRDLPNVRFTEQLSDTEGLQTLTLTLKITPSYLQTRNYECIVFSTSNQGPDSRGIKKVITVRGEDYREKDPNCSKCGDGGRAAAEEEARQARLRAEAAALEQAEKLKTAEKKEKRMTIALGSVCGLLLLMCFLQYYLLRLYKKEKKVNAEEEEEEEEEELSEVTKWERTVNRYKDYGMYPATYNPDYDEMRRKRYGENYKEERAAAAAAKEEAEKTGLKKELTADEILRLRQRELGLFD
ncbi:uncharacterized protein LOC134821034 [Bolinopsis microptera]|uniref:uncharacterized protein LOC134821034 n=1 Tax=Bolinopsis microptera TaxID=2820187 RepID=UPI003079AE2D